ncbi:hypothetical protein [Shigella phage ESh1]|nr:hypothetical protein [Shigella phage ESh1]
MRPVDATLCILLHVTSCCQCLFFVWLTGCLLIRLTPVSQGVALGRCPVDEMNSNL